MGINELKHNKIISTMVRKGIIANLVLVNPEMATKLLFRLSQGYSLNLKNPKTLNEKLQYLKLNDYYENTTVTMAVDKYRVREYLNKCGYGYLANDLVGKGYYSSVDEIDIDDLPNRFVMKCNHDCGSVVICKDKNNFDWKVASEKLRIALKNDYWKENAEVQYSNVKKCIVSEKYLEDSNGSLLDYKFYCFNGEPRLLYCTAPHIEGELLQMDYFDINFNRLNITRKGTTHLKCSITKPEKWEEMLTIARELSAPFPFVRIDLFSVNNKIYLSEFTFIPTGGLAKYEEEGIDLWLGTQLKLN
jgi:hypothetical protein